MAWTAASFYGLSMADALSYEPGLSSRVTGSDGSETFPTSNFGLTATMVEGYARGAKAKIESTLGRAWVIPITYTSSTSIQYLLQDILRHVVSGRAILAMSGHQNTEVAATGQRLIWEAIGNVNQPDGFATSLLGQLVDLNATAAANMGLTSGFLSVVSSSMADTDTEVETEEFIRHENPIDTEGDARLWL